MQTVTTRAPGRPYGLLLDGNDDLIFSTWFPFMIYSVNLLNRQVTTIVGNVTVNKITEGPALLAGIYQPTGLTFDELGNLYFTQMDTNSIWKVNATNYVSRFAGSADNNAGLINALGNDAKFNQPRNIVFDSKGRLFVTDKGNSAVRMINW